jgi:hypothetical protein
MKADEAAELRENWGDKPCNHDHVEKEYYLGAQTGDYVCTTCGRDFTSISAVEHDRQEARKVKSDQRNQDTGAQG